jgi:hypothetical protein
MQHSRFIPAMSGACHAASIVLAAVLFAVCVPALSAQQPTTPAKPDSAGAAMETMLRSMMDQQTARMAQLAAVSMTARLAVLAKPETAQNLATFVRNLYDALIAKGFSKDEALKIVTAFGGAATGSSSAVPGP